MLEVNEKEEGVMALPIVPLKTRPGLEPVPNANAVPTSPLADVPSGLVL